MIHGRRTLLLLPAALLLARCSPAPKPPPVLNLTIVGGADQNPDPSGNPAPVAVKVYQLSASAKFQSSDWTSLTQNEAATLGTDEPAPSQQFVVSPGQTLPVNFGLKPDVQNIGVVVLFRDIDHAQWRQMAPAAANGPTNLTLNISKLTTTLQPTPAK